MCRSMGPHIQKSFALNLHEGAEVVEKPWSNGNALWIMHSIPCSCCFAYHGKRHLRSTIQVYSCSFVYRSVDRWRLAGVWGTGRGRGVVVLNPGMCLQCNLRVLLVCPAQLWLRSTTINLQCPPPHSSSGSYCLHTRLNLYHVIVV